MTFPASYDGARPAKFVWAFHAAGNGNAQLKGIYGGKDLGKNYVMIYPKSSGNEWVYATERARYDAWFTEVTDKYCLDTAHMYATGHSSGAQMIVQLLAKGYEAFRGVAPVAASKYGTTFPATPVLYIQGAMDDVRKSDGKDVVDQFVASNGCAASVAYDVMACNGYQGKPVAPGCVAYQGCTAPTIWCSHDDGEYSGTHHGVPCFAPYAIFDFFESL